MAFLWFSMYYLIYQLMVVSVAVAVSYPGPSWPANIPSETNTITIETSTFMTIQTSDLDSLTDLEELYLPYHAMTEFPDLSPVADTLDTLHIKQGALATVSEARLEMLVNLKELNIGETQVTQLPDPASLGGTLKSLHLTKLPMVDPPGLVNSGSSLNTLSVAQIDSPKFFGVDGTIPRNFSDILENLPSLNKLSYGSYSSRNAPDFSSTPKLQEQLEYLYMNHIIGTDIDWQRLRDLPSLHTIGCKNCSLEYFPNLCKPWTKKDGLRLPSNPLVCDCRARFLKSLNAEVLQIDDKPCTAPPSMVNRIWADIQMEELVCEEHNENEANPGPFTKRSYKTKVLGTGYCSWPPVIGRHNVTSLFECAQTCFETQGCLYVSFNNVSSSYHECDITSFYGSELSLSDVPGADWIVISLANV